MEFRRSAALLGGFDHAAFDQLSECAYDFGVELAAGAAIELLHRVGNGESSLGGLV